MRWHNFHLHLLHYVATACTYHLPSKGISSWKPCICPSMHFPVSGLMDTSNADCGRRCISFCIKVIGKAARQIRRYRTALTCHIAVCLQHIVHSVNKEWPLSHIWAQVMRQADDLVTMALGDAWIRMHSRQRRRQTLRLWWGL